jgi:resuscitation-promoting factor RpfB
MGAAPGTGHGGASPGSVTTVALARPAAQVANSDLASAEYGTPRHIAMTLLRHKFHWKKWQFKYLDRLWSVESGWNRYAANPYSGAYGIPQAMPGSKMASAGPGWRWNARTQILWGLRYIRALYRTPYWAWLHQHETGWY